MGEAMECHASLLWGRRSVPPHGAIYRILMYCNGTGSCISLIRPHSGISSKGRVIEFKVIYVRVC